MIGTPHVFRINPDDTERFLTVHEEPPFTTDDDRAETVAEALREIAAAIREAAPKPLGRHVIGGSVPKPGERTEAEADREAWRELRAALAAEQAAHAETRAEVQRLRPTPDEDAAAEAVLADPHNLMGCYTQADMDDALAEAQATARREAIEEAARVVGRMAPELISPWGASTVAAAIRALATQAAERTAPDAQ